MNIGTFLIKKNWTEKIKFLSEKKCIILYCKFYKACNLKFILATKTVFRHPFLVSTFIFFFYLMRFPIRLFCTIKKKKNIEKKGPFKKNVSPLTHSLPLKMFSSSEARLVNYDCRLISQSVTSIWSSATIP